MGRHDFVRPRSQRGSGTTPSCIPLFYDPPYSPCLAFLPPHKCRLGRLSTSAIFSVVIQCGGFRALYGWLGDVWERVRAHKMARAGPPEWRGVGGRVYVEELLCVLARVPISVDMLRETVRRCRASGCGGCRRAPCGVVACLLVEDGPPPSEGDQKG